MKTSTQLLLASGVLAQLVCAAPRPLSRREDVVVVETVTQYEYDYVTATAGADQSSTSLVYVRSRGHQTRSAETTVVVTTLTSATDASTTESSASTTDTVADTTSTLSAYSTTASTTTASTTKASTTLTTSTSTTSTSSAASATATTSSGSSSSYTPNGIKYGLSGYVGIQDTAAFTTLSEYISWYSDYTPTTPDVGSVQGIPMLWGDGLSCTANTDDATRLTEFTAAVADSTPPIMFGFYEPDCDCPMSSDISDPATGAADWNTLLAPLASKGTVLGSPSMCKQKDEDWLTPFIAAGLDATWEVTSIHINKNSLAGAQADVEYYVATYGKPIWVSEFACVDDSDGFVPCTDQTEIDTFINEVVPYFQNNANVVAYGPSNGEGLGTVWPLLTSAGELSASGTTYLNAIKAL